jgi:hypothetical protein
MFDPWLSHPDPEGSMDKRRWLLFATYFILTFPIAAVWHLVLFPGAYAASALRAQPLFVMGILSTVVQGVVVAYLYPRLHRGGPPVREGLRFALIMGAFIASYGVLAEAGKFDVGSATSWVLHEGAFFALQWLVIGVAVAYVYDWARRRAER